MIHKLLTKRVRIYSAIEKIGKIIFMNYIGVIYIIQPNGSIRVIINFTGTSAHYIPKFQCFIRYVLLFILAFGLFYAKVGLGDKTITICIAIDT